MSDLNKLLGMMEEEHDSKNSSSVEKVDQAGLSSVADLARAIRAKEGTIAQIEKQLKTEKDQLLKLTDEEMPSMLSELGISAFALDDGSQVQVKSTYGASIRVSDRHDAFNWLRDHGYDDIIKNTVSCSFGRGEDDKAGAFSAFAEKEGFYAEQKTEVHSQTLRAFVKERVENGDEFPMELFGAWVGQRATIKKGK
mgnify:CR=1 FL=1|jgi:hypothetical protein|tara:strand:- start:1211 stop:1798 length:588 start_codon:yes stop_codon:yes gene_type:complete